MVTYSQTVVWAEVGGAMRLARNARAWVSDPVTGDPVDATQGTRTASYVDTDADGRCDFTAASWPVRIASSLATGAPSVIVMPIEAPTLLATAASDAAASAATASASAATIDETIATWAVDTSDLTVASLVGGSTSTRTAARAAFDPLRARSVKWDGAVGDWNGSTGTDDSAAFATAIATAAAASIPVYVPPGRYKLTSWPASLTTSLIGDGRTTTIIEAPQLVLNTPGITVYGISLVSSAQTPLVTWEADDIAVQDCRISWQASVTEPLYAWAAGGGCDKLRFVGNQIFGGGGIQFSACVDFLVHGNIIDCNYANPSLGAGGCHISQQSRGVVTSNTILNTNGSWLSLYSSGHRCVVANNRMEGCKGSAGMTVKVTMSDDPGNTSGPGNLIESTIITGNVMRGFSSTTTSTRAGIFAEYVDSRAVPAFSMAETARAVIITNNVLSGFEVTDPGNGATVSWEGIAFSGHNSIISGNVIRHMRMWNSATHVGIRLGRGTSGALPAKCLGVNVTGNIISGIEAGSGIEVSGDLELCRIDGNQIRRDEGEAIGTRHGVNVIAAHTLLQCSISNNAFDCDYASSGFGIRANFTTAVLDRCQINGNQFQNCGVSLYAVKCTSFIGNVLENAAGSNGFQIGATGGGSTALIFQGNHWTLSSDVALALTAVDGFIVTGNTAKSTSRMVYMTGVTTNGIIDANLSWTQTVPTYVHTFAGDMTAPDIATTTIGSMNKVMA